MDMQKERLFQLQVFQQTLSTLYMYPLRIYKNDCYTQLQNRLFSSSTLKKLYLLLDIENGNFEKLIKRLQYVVKKTPEKIEETSELYQVLNPYAEKLREMMWETQASNSLIFTREIKGDRRLWLFLLIYDIFPNAFIEKYFQTPYSCRCLLNMQSVYIQINQQYTLSIGRLFTEEEDNNRIVKSVLQEYKFKKMNIFELTTLSKKRRTFDIERLERKASHIKEGFLLFWKLQKKLPKNIEKQELENIAIFIYMISREHKIGNCSIKTKKFILNFENNELFISSNPLGELHCTSAFKNTLLKFDNKRDFFRGEYASRLKSTLSKRYSGLGDDTYSAIEELLKHICRRLSADGGCYIAYRVADEQVKMIANYGKTVYKKGMERVIENLNKKEPNTLKKSRIIKVIKNYYNSSQQFDIESLIFQNLSQYEILQPIQGEIIRSNIALPITFNQKLLGILLIDSFRIGNFTENDINLILSISSALSVQIFDQIVEKNISSIMENLPQKAHLEEQDIQQHFEKLTLYINNIFFSYGISIWKYEAEKECFRLKSSTLAFENPYCTIKREDNNLLFDLLDNEKNMVVSYNIGEEKQLSICNPKLYDSRINCVKIYAIYSNEELIGAFSVYNHSVEDYKSIDEKSLYSVTKHLAIFFNIMNTLKEQRALAENSALHEIHARLNMMQDKTTQLREMLYNNFKGLDHYIRYRFNIKLDDMTHLISNTRLAFQYITNKSEKREYNNHVDDEVINLYEPLQLKNKESNHVRYLLNEINNAIPYPYNCKNIRINNMVNENIKLKVHNLILSDIFQNILLNAVKYSFQGTTIRLYSKITSNTVRIYIKNDGLKIRKEEEIDIFKYGYRGYASKHFKEEIQGETISYQEGANENLGIGLYKCNQLTSKVLTGEIRLTVEPSRIKNASVNTFEIILPKQLLKGEIEI